MTYSPPTQDEMRATQNSDRALQLLVAQRATYSVAKRFLAARLAGMIAIAIGAPLLGLIFPKVAVACAALAGVWIFLGRTSLAAQQDVRVSRGAAVQERFDATVFGMPNGRGREHMLSLEEVAKLAGSGSDMRRSARDEKLKDWYPLEPASDPATAVAICQRANVSYSDSLLRTTARVWRLSMAGWAGTIVTLSIVLHLSVENFLLVVVLPLLPSFLDLMDFSREYESASHVRRSTAQEIEQAITGSRPIDPGKLLAWQERIYELRRSTPLVPDVVYWAGRKANERAMNASAEELAK